MLVPSNDTKALLEKATAEYQSQLPGSLGERYLTARGITKEAVRSFRLGFLERPLPEDRHLRNRISIPYITAGGIVGIKYRSISDLDPKYKSNVGFESKRIFNPMALNSKHRKVYVCEGEIDCITLVQIGLPAVAIPGVSNWDRRASRAFRNRRVIVAADGDDVGQGLEFAKTVTTDCEDSGYVLLEGNDVNSLFLSDGAERLKEVLGWVEK